MSKSAIELALIVGVSYFVYIKLFKKTPTASA